MEMEELGLLCRNAGLPAFPSAVASGQLWAT